MSDIANAASVSRSAVSSVLGNAQSTIRVSALVQKKIIATAKEMGYRRNELARAMVTGQTRVIAYITSEDSHYDYVTDRLKNFLKQTQAMGYMLKVFYHHQGRDVTMITDLCISHRVQAVAIDYFANCETMIEEFNKAGIAVALHGGDLPGKKYIGFHHDDRRGLEKVVSHLYELGHRRIAMVTGGKRFEVSVTRAEAFVAALKAHDLPVNEKHISYAEDWAVEAARIEAEAMLSLPSKERPTAICCASDILAMGVLRAVRRKHLAVPQDISITGLANMYVAELADPPLTSIAHGAEASCKETLALLIKNSLSKNLKDIENTYVQEEMSLVVRDSTGPASI